MLTFAFFLGMLSAFLYVNKTISALTKDGDDTMGRFFLRIGYALFSIAAWTWYHHLSH